MVNRIITPSNSYSYFLFGARGTGKTTLLKKLFSQDDSWYIDLLDPELQLDYNKNPNLLIQQVEELKDNSTIFIDEVQRVPKILDVIHSLMEQKPKHKYILCGSSARRIRHGAANLLGGRALYRTMHPLTFEELSKTFNLNYHCMPTIY